MMDWKECIDKRFVKDTKKDENLMNSLIKSSEKKLETNKQLKLNETTASTKVCIVYDSLREILEAFAIKKGFKIYNHECFCSFLNEICKEFYFSQEFDRFRRLRNQINYYGKDISINEAEIIIKEIILLRKRIISKYLKEY